MNGHTGNAVRAMVIDCVEQFLDETVGFEGY